MLARMVSEVRSSGTCVCVRAHVCVCYVKYGADVMRNELVVVVRCLMLGVLSTM